MSGRDASHSLRSALLQPNRLPRQGERKPLQPCPEFTAPLAVIPSIHTLPWKSMNPRERKGYTRFGVHHWILCFNTQWREEFKGSHLHLQNASKAGLLEVFGFKQNTCSPPTPSFLGPFPTHDSAGHLKRSLDSGDMSCS